MPPTVLTGLTYYVHSGAIPDRLVFSSATSGTAYPGTSVVSSGRRNDESNPTGNIFTYTYSVDHSNSAHLTLNFGYYGLGGDKNEYELQFTDGPSGLFSRRIYRLGSLFATDSGAFSPYAVLPSTNSGGTNGTVTLENPPTNPKGYTYNVNVDGIVERLVFQSDTAGIDYDDSAPTDYTYTYASTGTRKFSLVVQFKADRWDEYALSFSSGGQGSYVRRRFRNNALIKTSSGTFTVSNNGK